MTQLYPIKFEPILKNKIWGGSALSRNWGKTGDLPGMIGESWEISAVPGDLSIVSNGFLAGNTIEEIIEVYMGDITGDTIFEKYGVEFPLLIKFIDTELDLSVQVHPGNNLAKERHNGNGKTEMWYILESRPGARIYTGFSNPLTREAYSKAVSDGSLPALLKIEYTEPGGVFFTPAGRIHSIGKGNTLIEIQQTSDITYRIFDWNRKNPDGTSRELHAEMAADAVDLRASGKNMFHKKIIPGESVNLVSCEYFTTNIIGFNKTIKKDYSNLDSFVIYICIEGELIIHYGEQKENVKTGETVLLPAAIRNVSLDPVTGSKLLEIYLELTTFNT